MELEQREQLARLIAEFGSLRWKHQKEDAEKVFEEIMDILLPESKEH